MAMGVVMTSGVVHNCLCHLYRRHFALVLAKIVSIAIDVVMASEWCTIVHITSIADILIWRLPLLTIWP